MVKGKRMAIFHLNITAINRAKGGNAVKAAAYRARSDFKDLNTDAVYRYGKMGDHRMTAMFWPENMPAADRMLYRNPGDLWSMAEAAEVSVNTGVPHKRATVAREIDVALPVELTDSQQHALLDGFVREAFIRRGMIAQVSVHEGKGTNPHAHILLTTREWDAANGGFNVEVGHKGKLDWDRKETLVEWREMWADHVNYQLDMAGYHDVRVDHRSLADQGIDRLPQTHEGPKVRALAGKVERLIDQGAEIPEGTVVPEIHLVNLFLREQALTRQLELAGKQRQRQAEKEPDRGPGIGD
jgi:hypothetical protein